jgi:hypothetical protein
MSVLASKKNFMIWSIAAASVALTGYAMATPDMDFHWRIGGLGKVALNAPEEVPEEGQEVEEEAAAENQDALPEVNSILHVSNTNDYTVVGGLAPSGQIIEVRDRYNKVIGTGVAEDNKFLITVWPSITSSTNITVNAKDAEGNVLDTVTQTARTWDTRPTDLSLSPDGKTISGRARGGTFVIAYDDDNTELGRFFQSDGYIGVTRNFSMSLSRPLAAGERVRLRGQNTAGQLSNWVSYTAADDVGETAPACSSEVLIPGKTYSQACGLGDVPYDVIYVGDWNGEPLFLTKSTTSKMKKVGVDGSSPDGYANTLQLVDNWDSRLNGGWDFAAYHCLTWAASPGKQHGFFLPSLDQLKRLWDGTYPNSFRETTIGLGKDTSGTSTAYVVMSDIGNNLIVLNTGLTHPALEPSWGKLTCGITPTSIQAAK